MEWEVLRGPDVDLVVVEAAEEAGRLVRKLPVLSQRPPLKTSRARGGRVCSGVGN